MRKYLFLLIPLLAFLISFPSKAISNSDLTKVKNLVTTKYGYTISDTFATQVINYWESHNTTYPYMVITNQNGELRFSYSMDTPYQSGSNLQMRGIYTQKYQPAYSGQVAFDPFGIGNATFGYSFDNSYNFGTWSSFHQGDIDWSNPQYNPNLPIPEFTTNYGEISVNSSSPEIPFDITFLNPNNDYYIEIWCDYWIPENISISINRGVQNNDGYVYKALSKELVYGYLIDPEQMLKIPGINNFKLQLQTSWENALDEVPASSIEYANPNNLPSGMFNQYKNSYENYCRRILGFYGSQFTIMMRYFTIVNDSEYVIGAWRTWTSYSPNEFTERIPDYYVPYVPASGQENITNDVDPETVNVVPGSGTSTGVVADPNYYITVNQNTPNYPDYPTVASYNKDNLLLDTINQMNSLSEFFGQFGDFLKMSFSFFPAWIWAIIGVGFSISIVVMFLKIL